LKVAITVLSAGLALTVPPKALGYQEAGHFYTVRVVTYLIGKDLMSDSDARLVSFCAQLPDQSEDLDAVVVYKNLMKKDSTGWLKWAVGDDVDSEWTKRMLTVQQLLHGLTGGEASALQAVAGNVLGKLYARLPGKNDPSRPAGLCALGFGFHLYGDAFAHQMMGEAGNDPDEMYPTGRGHAADLHYPDLPLCSQYAKPPRVFKHGDAAPDGRFGRWAEHWAKAAQYLGRKQGGAGVDPAVHKKIVDDVFNLASKASDSNSWEEADMAKELAQPLGYDYAMEKFLKSHQSDKPCEDVLKSAIDGGLLKDVVGLRCRAGWDVFYNVSRAEFGGAGNGKARKPLRGGISPDSAYLANPLSK